MAKTIVIVILCLIEIFIFAAFGFKRGGGLIPMIAFIFVPISGIIKMKFTTVRDVLVKFLSTVGLSITYCAICYALTTQAAKSIERGIESGLYNNSYDVITSTESLSAGAIQLVLALVCVAISVAIWFIRQKGAREKENELKQAKK